MARVGAIDPAGFGPVYREAVRDIAPFLTPDRLEVIARHNPGWRPERFDAVAYLETSEARYSAALAVFEGTTSSGKGSRCGNLDLSEPLDSQPDERFDLVLAMAILEHLPSSRPVSASSPAR